MPTGRLRRAPDLRFGLCPVGLKAFVGSRVIAGVELNDGFTKHFRVLRAETETIDSRQRLARIALQQPKRFWEIALDDCESAIGGRHSAVGILAGGKL